MKAKDFREMSDDELRQELDNRRRELFNLGHRRVVEQLENPAQLRNTKKDVARILTVLREREFAAAHNEDAAARSEDAAAHSAAK